MVSFSWYYSSDRSPDWDMTSNLEWDSPRIPGVLVDWDTMIREAVTWTKVIPECTAQEDTAWVIRWWRQGEFVARMLSSTCRGIFKLALAPATTWVTEITWTIRWDTSIHFTYYLESHTVYYFSNYFIHTLKFNHYSFSFYLKW